MYQVFLNDEPQRTENALKTWGELLPTLDAHCQERGEVVTAVRFDGVDQPAFREGRLEGCDLSGVAAIEIEAARPADLLLATIDEAEKAVETLQAAAERIGGSFRGFDVSRASEELGDLAGGLRGVVALADALSQAMGLGLADVTWTGGSGAQMVEELTVHADAIIGAQEIGDWITVADIVEYDLAPCLRRWHACFEAFRASVPAVVAPVA